MGRPTRVFVQSPIGVTSMLQLCAFLETEERSDFQSPKMVQQTLLSLELILGVRQYQRAGDYFYARFT